MRCAVFRFFSRFRWAFAIAALFTLAVTQSVYAQEADPSSLSLEELLNAKVFSASKYETNAAESPTSISVISAEEIQKYGYRTLLEVLQNETGFYVRNHISYSTLGVRGFAPLGESSGRILVLVNGHTINNNIDDSSPLENDFPVDMDLVDRIEVVRGPSSSLFGTGAFFAVVNVIIRPQKGAAAQISGETGSLGTYKGTATYNYDRNGTQALLSANYWDSDAPGRLSSSDLYNKSTEPDPLGSSSDRDQTRRAFVMLASHGFTLQGAASAVEQKAPPTAGWCGSCHQTDSHSTNFHGYGDLQYSHQVWQRTQFTARAYYDNYASHGAYNIVRGSQTVAPTCGDAYQCHGPMVDYDVAHGNRAGGELDFTKRLFDKDKITIGAEYRDNFQQAWQNNLDYYTDANCTETGMPNNCTYPENPNSPPDLAAGWVPASRSFGQFNRTSALWGVYGEGEIRLHRTLLLDVGARWDRYNYFVGSATSPRAALIYTPYQSTNLRFMYGTAFRAPNFYELYYLGMTGTAATELMNNDPKPEKIRTFEAAWTQKVGSHLSFSLVGFNNHIGNYIEEETYEKNTKIDQTEFVNSKAISKGGEFELIDGFSSGAKVRLSYTYQEAEDVKPLQDPVTLTTSVPVLGDSPKHLAKANVEVPVFHRWVTPAVEAQWMSRSSTDWPAIVPSAPPVEMNVTLSSRQIRGFALSGSAYNLVGRSMSPSTAGFYEETQTIPSTSLLPSDRRTFRLKLTWTSGETSSKDKSNTQLNKAY